ncbi:hypothetical protein AbraIFM66950_004312 [Aspergillus brasiliensis]|nr:hypothetical protein AbraIFM66950_004312 [Aspergillus brasiliensis]
MSVRVFIYAYRKPGLDLRTFEDHYEAHIHLIELFSATPFPYISRARTSRAVLFKIQQRNSNNSRIRFIVPFAIGSISE